MFNAIIDWIFRLPAPLVLAVAFAFPALEASIFIGVVVPGEIGVLIAGVVANGGKVNIAWVIIAACLGAVIGDFIGFEVGKRWGDKLLAVLPKKIVKPEHIEKTKEVLRKRGAIAIIGGRWVAALRAFMPGIAGMSGISTRMFVTCNIIGGCTWASVIAVAGYLAGTQYHRVEEIFGKVSTFALIALAAALVLYIGYRVIKGRRPAR